MTKEIELGHLAVTDRRGRSGYMVLTNRRVYHQNEGGVFGNSETFIPHQAITSVQIGWRRLWWILVLGVILLAVCGYSIIGGLEPILQYGLLAGGLILFFLFWFYKTSEIQILSPTASVGGRPEKHEDGRKFCDLLLSVIGEEEQGKMGESTATSKKKASEAEWRL